MCGITGIISKNSNPSQAELQRMNDLISHRGPDGEGFYIHNNVGFGHRRLAIIDLTQDGHQPMHLDDQYVITYNGEVYNYLEIKTELQKLGHQFQSHSDTEVIIVAYKQWGEECVKRFNGMWAFAIHDKQKNILFCSRDRFGVKPFYYRQFKTEFKFGSEIKQLINMDGTPNPAHKDLIAHYLYTGMHDHEDRTFFVEVMKLPPSHNLIFSLESHKFEIKKYFTLDDYSFTESYEELLESAVKLRLRSDVKVGTCLSGGLDSSTIAAIASKNYKSESRFSAVHAQSIEKETDESYYAHMVADSSNIDMHITKPGPEEFKSILDEVVYTQEEPFGSPSIYFQYFVMKKAKEIGCKVMLDGQGGDETLLGYERYYAPALMQTLRDQGFGDFLRELKATKENNSKMSLKTIIKYIAGTYLISIRGLYARYKHTWFKRAEIPKRFEYQEQIKKHSFNLKKMQELELYTTNLQALLRYEDKNSMRHSIETRLPFLDYRCVTKALNLPLKDKIQSGWTKHCLRLICAKWLPSDVAWRKSKLGFNAPDRSWLRDLKEEFETSDSMILKNYLNNNLTHPVSGTWTISWRILNIRVWERIFKVELQ